MTAGLIGKRIIKTVSSIVDFAVLVIVFLLLAYSGYSLWDSKQIYEAADSSNYSIYKPTEANGRKTFQELQAINPDVFSWIHIYGTNIDYPVVQGRDNLEYINNNAEGRYSVSGSIFLDVDNSKDYSDFNSVLYGHHMEKKKMFGDIGTFRDKDVFESRLYGNLYYDGKNHGIELFAFVHTDAYDSLSFTPNVSEANRQNYLDQLFAKAINKRDIDVTTKDHILLMSTCSSSSTNGRDILFGRITHEVFKDPFTDSASINGDKISFGTERIVGFFMGIPEILLILLVIIVPLLLTLILLEKNRLR